MRPNWPKLASLATKTCTLDIFSSLKKSLLPKDNSFKNHFKQTGAELSMYKANGNSVDITGYTS